MKKLFTLGQFKAQESATASEFETIITGKVFPFVSDFKDIEYVLTIEHDDDESKKSIFSSVSFSGDYAGGSDAMLYINAATVAHERVQSLLSISNEFRNNSTTLIKEAIKLAEQKDYEQLLMTILLAPSLNEKTSGTWKHDNRKDQSIIDAMVSHPSFSVIVNSAHDIALTAGTDAFKNMSDTSRTIFQIVTALTSKSSLVDSIGKNRPIKRAVALKMLQKGVTVKSILTDRELYSSIQHQADKIAEGL